MVRAVRVHGFVNSSCPVIVTLENHVSKPTSQKKMARILREELGELLYRYHDGDEVTPERLKGRVILRDKGESPPIPRWQPLTPTTLFTAPKPHPPAAEPKRDSDDRGRAVLAALGDEAAQQSIKSDAAIKLQTRLRQRLAKNRVDEIRQAVDLPASLEGALTANPTLDQQMSAELFDLVYVGGGLNLPRPL